jgi:eukaryotic-like serine/threonine-protein kinase
VIGEGWSVEGKSRTGAVPSTLHLPPTTLHPPLTTLHPPPTTLHPPPPPTTRYYQLTHDYLVPSLRDWLTRKQKETRRGRAELLLADRAFVWSARPENRQLPSLLQWLQIKLLTQSRNWTGPQQKMMRKATYYHLLRGAAYGLLLAVATITGLVIRQQDAEQRKATHAVGLVQRLLYADTPQVPAVIDEMSAYHKWVDPLLREENNNAAANSAQKLHTSLALLSVDPTQVEYLYGELLDAAPNDVRVISDALAPYKGELVDKLWSVAEAPERGKELQRLRAASALAKYDPTSERWANCSNAVAYQLVGENPVFLGVWMEGLRPIKEKLLVSLVNIYRDPNGRESERTLATNILADFAGNQPKVLADLLMDADEKQFAVIYKAFRDQREQGLPVLTGEIDLKLPLDAKDDAKEILAKRQANAAVALLRMKQPEKVWPLLKHSPNPRARSYLIHRLCPLGAEAGAIIKRVDEEPDVTIRRALVLSLGEYGETDLSPEARKAVLPRFQDIYRTAADPGLHASAEWLLRQWKHDAWLKQINEEWTKDNKQWQKRLESIEQSVTKGKEKAPQWYVNGQGQTMVVIPGPVEFVMGSPPTEAGRQDVETQHKKRIGRTFAIGAKAVTVEQYRQFDKGYSLPGKYTRAAELPVVGTSWYQAAAYCNWLSKQEGIPEDQWCYEIKGQVTNLKARYLSLAGYRLPTEAEMEYATRAGAITSRYFGEADELLPKYAWYQKNSQEQTWPVGSLKPNDLGLFDVQGNVYTWCQEKYVGYPLNSEGIVDDKEYELGINTDSRVLRGGSFYYHASLVRSAYRIYNAPATRLIYYGFRPARTFTP